MCRPYIGVSNRHQNQSVQGLGASTRPLCAESTGPHCLLRAPESEAEWSPGGADPWNGMVKASALRSRGRFHQVIDLRAGVADVW